MAIIICSELRNVLKAQVLIVQAGHWHQVSTLFHGACSVRGSYCHQPHFRECNLTRCLLLTGFGWFLKLTLLILYVLID